MIPNPQTPVNPPGHAGTVPVAFNLVYCTKPPPRVYKHSTLPAANPASYAVICPFLRRHMGVLTPSFHPSDGVISVLLPSARACSLQAGSSARRTRRLSPCGLSPLGIRDTGQDAHQGMVRLGRFITSPCRLPAPLSQRAASTATASTVHLLQCLFQGCPSNIHVRI